MEGTVQFVLLLTERCGSLLPLLSVVTRDGPRPHFVASILAAFPIHNHGYLSTAYLMYLALSSQELDSVCAPSGVLTAISGGGQISGARAE